MEARSDTALPEPDLPGAAVDAMKMFPCEGGKAADRVLATIRHAIVSGRLAAGQHLVETDMAGRLGVSRTPVREAFRQLEAEGWVAITPHLGVRVTAWSVADVQDVYNIRAHLESEAARLAAKRSNAEDLKALSDLAVRIRDIGGKIGIDDEATEERCDLNAAFHEAIFKLSGNKQIMRMLTGMLNVPMVRWNTRSFDPDQLARSDAHHFEIIEALKCGDGDWAAAAMQTHIFAGRAAILGRLAGEEPGDERRALT